MLENYNKNSDCFCPYYNQGLLIDSNNMGQTRVAMCCFQNRSDPVTEVRFDHPYLESMRMQGAHNVPDQCTPSCKDNDYFLNERLRAIQQQCWDDSGKQIKKLHLKQGLICNLECISCSSELSSAWSTHYHHFDPKARPLVLNKTTRQSWKHLDLSALSELHFDGGEPLLNRENVSILEELDHQGLLPQVSLTYNTNGTVMPDQHLLALWAKTRWVRLYFSLDGVGSVFEYTRYPAKWSQVESNIQAFTKLKEPCILLEVNAVVGIHNIFNLKEFYNWWTHCLPTGNQGDPSQIFVRQIEPTSVGGKALSLNHLPLSLKSAAVDYIHDLTQLPGSQDLLKNIAISTSVEWLEFFDKLDTIRGTNWKHSLPKQLQNYA